MQIASIGFDLFTGSMRFNTQSIGDPGGKYGLFYFPKEVQAPLWEHTRNPYVKLFGSGLQNISTVMGARDALVWFAELPPVGSVDYYSITDYVLFRFHKIPFYDGYLPAVPMNDPLNQLVLKRLSGESAIVVCTASQHTWEWIQKTLCAYEEKCEINLLPVTPSARLLKDPSDPWVLSEADILTWQFRVNGVRQQDILENYFSKTQPFFLLRAKDNDDDDDRLLPLPLRIRQEPGELSQSTFYQETRMRLEGEVREWMLRGFSNVSWILNETIHHIVPDLQKCLEDDTYMPVFPPLPGWGFPGLPGCDYFVRDALYSLTPSIYTEEMIQRELRWDNPDKIYVVMGLNQQQMGECLFSNLLLTGSGSPESEHHTFNFSSHDLQGSAAELFGAEYKEWFVHAWSRNCADIGSSVCTTVQEEEISYDEYLFFAERKYLNPMTAIGPSPFHLLPPLLLIGTTTFTYDHNN